MNKKFYIIPGWTETCRSARYKALALTAEKKGYEVVCVKINWKKKLSDQYFKIEKDSVIFGFSLGAVLARLIAQDQVCAHIILASMTPLTSFTVDKQTKKALIELLGKEFTNDISKKLTPVHKAKRQTILYGDREGEDFADVFVSKTGHMINDIYIGEINKLL